MRRYVCIVSIRYLTCFVFKRCRGGLLEPIPTHTHNSFSHSHLGAVLGSNRPKPAFFLSVCEEKTHTVLMYREALGSTLELNPSPSCCEATVLSIKPPSHQINVHSLILLRCLIQLPAGERRGRFIGIGGRRRGSTTGSRSGSLPKTGSLAKQVACV